MKIFEGFTGTPGKFEDFHLISLTQEACDQRSLNLKVRIHANLKSQTVEELRGHKKALHLAAFSYAIAETARDLEHLADEGGAEDRLQWDWTRKYQGVTHTVAGLLGKIREDCEVMLARHESVPPERYAVDEAFHVLVAEMLQTKTAAMSTLRWYLEDETTQMQQIMSFPIVLSHRKYIAFLEQTLAPAGDERVRGAEQLCRVLCLMDSSPDETDAEGLTPLMRAAADGAGPRALRCLAAARADVNARDRERGRTALYLAASFGHTAVVEELHRLGADADLAAYPGAVDAAPVYIAAQEGHAEVVAALGRLGADVNRADAQGFTPVYMATEKGHVAVIEALGLLGADVNRANKKGWTPLKIAVTNGHEEAVEALRRFGAK